MYTKTGTILRIEQHKHGIALKYHTVQIPESFLCSIFGFELKKALSIQNSGHLGSRYIMTYKNYNRKYIHIWNFCQGLNFEPPKKPPKIRPWGRKMPFLGCENIQPPSKAEIRRTESQCSLTSLNLAEGPVVLGRLGRLVVWIPMASPKMNPGFCYKSGYTYQTTGTQTTCANQ